MARQLVFAAWLGLILPQVAAEASVDLGDANVGAELSATARSLQQDALGGMPLTSNAVAPSSHMSVPPPAAAPAGQMASGNKPFNPKKLVGPIVGGVAGAAALAGVIAVSVMKKNNATTTARTTTAPVIEVKGSLTLQVPDEQAFLKDMSAQKALGAGIADVAGVPAQYVEVKAKASHGYHLKRRLAAGGLPQNIQADYKVKLPPTDKAHTKQGVEELLSVESADLLTSAVQARMTAVKGNNYAVMVLRNQVGSKPPVTAKMCNTFQCPANYVIRPHASMLGGSDWQTCCQVRKTTLTTTTMTTTTLGTTTTTTTDDFLILPQNASDLLAGLSTTLPANITHPSSSFAALGGHANVLVGIGGGLAGCAVLACCLGLIANICCGKKKRGLKKPSKESYMPDDAEYAPYFDEEPLMNKRGAHSDLPGTAPEMVSQYMQIQPDMASHYTGSKYMAASQYGGPRGSAPAAAPAAAPVATPIYAGMTSLPAPPPPPAAGGPAFQASPLANTVQSVSGLR
jgi:hypothetical protein